MLLVRLLAKSMDILLYFSVDKVSVWKETDPVLTAISFKRHMEVELRRTAT